MLCAVTCQCHSMYTKWNYQVEGEAQGDDDSIQKLLKDLDQGPSAAHVVKVEKAEIDIKDGEASFETK